ncbi:hypothetical protein DACRYDRAFT_63532 [Dacryopinax primogenitus]|uniref:FIT family protein scs3 n=1 Tax=Dacryopinax primogenitus (strain DJM 731) TaxID=1858805 RepID=M5GCM7_DACPD|nr:uncharacterized protein DACRYDRAFT_63532 [Dacryopinax primogenitus]EJU03962.1 hypothetical protein DACRYDRAFT_63532 [Dacryopinax primogenitus]
MVTIFLGTLLSHLLSLTQSESLVALQTPSSATHSYFANKHNVFNLWFVKYAWGWTSFVFVLHWLAAPKGVRRPASWVRYTLATLAFLAFTAWFFGPAMMDRLRILSGGECVLPVPSPPASTGTSLSPPSAPYLLRVPYTLCYTRTPLSPSTHPELFAQPDIPAPPAGFRLTPRLRKGHDVSGHIFLLTLAVLFLVDEVALSWGLIWFARTRGVKPTWTHLWATVLVSALLVLWGWMVLITSVYFHTPEEKFSGFVIGLAAYAFSQIPLPFLDRWLDPR